MLYTKETLLQDEQILFYTRPHYIIFYTSFVLLALGVFLIEFTINALLGGTMLLIGVISFLGNLVGYYCSEYAVTSKRILIKVGFIRRRSLEIFLERVEGVYVEQGVIGRILNFGTVTVAGVGGTKNPFFYIPNPLKFRNCVQQQMQKGNGK